MQLSWRNSQPSYGPLTQPEGLISNPDLMGTSTSTPPTLLTSRAIHSKSTEPVEATKLLEATIPLEATQPLVAIAFGIHITKHLSVPLEQAVENGRFAVGPWGDDHYTPEIGYFRIIEAEYPDSGLVILKYDSNGKYFEHEYRITESSTLPGVQGFVGKITIFADAEHPGTSFAVFTAKWESGKVSNAFKATCAKALEELDAQPQRHALENMIMMSADEYHYRQEFGQEDGENGREGKRSNCDPKYDYYANVNRKYQLQMCNVGPAYDTSNTMYITKQLAVPFEKAKAKGHWAAAPWKTDRASPEIGDSRIFEGQYAEIGYVRTICELLDYHENDEFYEHWDYIRESTLLSGVQGYISKTTIFADSENPERSIVIYRARWESGEVSDIWIDHMYDGIDGMDDQSAIPSRLLDGT